MTANGPSTDRGTHLPGALDTGSTLDELTAGRTGKRRLRLRGGTVVSMDPTIDVLRQGDVLIEGTRIVEVAPIVEADDVVDVDVSGSIVCPGFVDTHRHAWQAQMRRTIPDVDDLAGYLSWTLAKVAPAYSPDDMRVGTRLAALTALDCGITTMLDFSHNSRTPEHSDAAVEGLAETGIRGIHASMGPHFGDGGGQWPADLARLKSEFFSSDDQLLTLRLAALATPEISGPRLAYGERLGALARDLDIGVSLDVMFGKAASEAVVGWERLGILGPRVTSIHSTALSPQAWEVLAETGTTVSLAPTSDAQIGLEDGVPPVDDALAHGIRPGLSVDVEVALSSDMFTQMRTLLALQRMRATERAYGSEEPEPKIGTHDVLDFATISGARTNALGDVTGSLTPGKQADVIVIDAEDVNTMPLHDPIGTIVLGADRANVRAVWVAGQVRKWDGRLVGVDVDALRRDVHASVEAVTARIGPETETR